MKMMNKELYRWCPMRSFINVGTST
ncbi:hypothetical protein Golob_024424, partial [Gossypium lobatum]|nr:hypothetical protein [Gossypium lobatum]